MTAPRVAAQGRTKVKLGATGGLRLLPGGKAELILDRVRDFLRASPFLLDEDAGVTILDGPARLIPYTLYPLPLAPSPPPWAQDRAR